ncbi:MAG: serine/threonine protein kinase, partial [Acidobacteria bacterium]|nr:serine/threonine protein kinase [Acidobacteriota bacterium]
MTPERWRKIESIFQTVVEKPKPERQQMLTQYCGNDTELRREVEALLSEDDTNDFDDFIQAPIKDVARSLPQPNPDNYVGRNIGPYHVVKLLGQGGMGAVYLAERADAEFYRQVALKIVRRGMDSNFVLKRFRMERQILATLEHPNIAQLLDGGTTADGLPYFVMEYVQGQPLTEYCDSSGISLTERLKLFLFVCAAVQHAHQKLIIHRDLKPSNILVTAEGIPKLLDFGIAKLLDPALSPTPVTRTQTSMRLMTPDYASPEQVRGLPVTTASDVYALGVILFELLTGARPYQFETYSPAEIERAICDTEIERPSALAERMNDEGGRMNLVARLFHHSSFIPHRSSLRGDLDNIVLMALRKEPERRYQSVEQLAEDIRCYLQGRPISARRESALYRTGKFVRRNKLAVAAATLVFFSLLGGIVTTTRAARIAESERARAEANLAEAQAQRAEADRQRLIAEEQRTRAEAEAAEANLQRQIAEAQHAEADAQRRNAETQQERAERRFAQVRKLANTFLFDFHDKIAALPGSTEAREMVVKTALEYLDSLAKEAEGDVSLQNELA